MGAPEQPEPAPAADPEPEHAPDPAPQAGELGGVEDQLGLF